MKRSRIFITVLFSLFIFQSLWNVAAAFCIHENSQTSQNSSHFGHHISVNIHSHESNSTADSTKDTSNDHSQNQYPQIQLDDHTDHLPSFAHFMLLEFRNEMSQIISVYSHKKPYFDWHNLYQSPFLAFLTPPPNLTPL